MKIEVGLFSVFFSLNCVAGPYASLGIPEVKGNGCRENSVNATLAPDGSALTILFDNFIAEAGGNKKQDRKNCRIIVPIDLEADETISILKMDYRGYTALPKKGVSDLTVDYYFGRKQGSPTTERFRGETDKEFTVTDSVRQPFKEWAPCGRPLRLHIQAGIDVKSNEKGEQALISIDSVDMSNGIIYKLERKKCKRVKDDRWDNPTKKKMEDLRERQEEKDRDDRFEKRPWKELLAHLMNR